MPRKTTSRAITVGNTDAYVPTAARPVRSRARPLVEDAHFEPHSHPWAQLAYCGTGLIQVMVRQVAQDGALEPEVNYIVPPSRAVWIPPTAQHAISVVEAAELRTLYIDPAATPAGWNSARVIVVTPLLRELIAALNDSPPHREPHLAALALDEITHADTQALGVPMPRDKRLRALCEAVLHDPTEHSTLADWARNIGASERTVARLFRDELSTSYQQWRQQVLLARALPLLARGAPVSEVAAASGYTSDSAFSAMFKAAMGQSPSHFQTKNRL